MKAMGTNQREQVSGDGPIRQSGHASNGARRKCGGILLQRERREMTKPQIIVEEGRAGLFYATSPDVPGLLVAEKTREACEAGVPKALADLKYATPAQDEGLRLQPDGGTSPMGRH